MKEDALWQEHGEFLMTTDYLMRTPGLLDNILAIHQQCDELENDRQKLARESIPTDIRIQDDLTTFSRLLELAETDNQKEIIRETIESDENSLRRWFALQHKFDQEDLLINK